MADSISTVVPDEDREEARDEDMSVSESPPVEEPARVVPVKVEDCESERDFGSKTKDVAAAVIGGSVAVGRTGPPVVESAGRRGRWLLALLMLDLDPLPDRSESGPAANGPALPEVVLV